MQGQKYLKHVLHKVVSKKKFVIPLLFCVMLIIIFLWLFWPWQKIDIRSLKNDEVVYISDIEIIKPSFRSMVADVIQVPLGLRWYDVCLKNGAYLEGPKNCTEVEKPVLRVYFKQGDPYKYSNVSLQKAFDGLSDEKIYEIPYEVKECFIYSGQDGFLIEIAYFWSGHCASSRDLGSSFRGGYDFYAKPNPRALLIKFFLILVFGIVFFASLLTIFSFYKGRKFKNNNKNKSLSSKKE